jgi:hypothetical protein
MHLGIYDQRDSDITPLREVARDVAGPGLGRSTRRAPSPRLAACSARSLTSPNPVTALSGRLGTTPAELAHSLQSAPELLDQVTTTCDRETT